MPDLTVRPATGPTGGVVLVLPGGKAASLAPARARHLSAVRMIPFARALHRTGQGVAVWTLRYTYRGWNGDEAHPVTDARWALAEIRREHGDAPVVLVGHSMGGRTALRVADDPSVTGVVALAPWLPPGEPVAGVTGKRVLLVHGTADRWTDPLGTRRFAELATPLASELRHVEIAGVGHPMLRRAALWHGLTTYFALDFLSTSGSPRSAYVEVDTALL